MLSCASLRVPTGSFEQPTPQLAVNYQRYLPESAKFVYPVYRGPLGAYHDGALLFWAVNGDRLEGAAVLPGPQGQRVEGLPPLHDDWVFDELQTVIVDDVNGDGDNDIVVMCTYMTGMGPTGSQPFHHNRVFVWNGDTFVTEVALTKKISILSAVEDVHEIIGQ